MIPQHWVLLESLPLTATGKLDRKALPAPSTEFSQLDESYVAPRNNVERLLAEIWQQVFGLQRVGVHDNFFELGGDSIRSIQVIARANKQGLRLSPKLLFQHQTISELTEEFASDVNARDEKGADVAPLRPAEDSSFAQSGEETESVKTGGFTPSDFPHARINQKDLNLLIAGLSRASERKP
jgi:aryl carrier-like protein